jgi:hypothetical protein
MAEQHSFTHVTLNSITADSKHVFNVLLVSICADGYMYASCIHVHIPCPLSHPPSWRMYLDRLVLCSAHSFAQYIPPYSFSKYIHSYKYDKYMLPIVMYDRTHSLAHVARAASRADSKHVFDSVLLVSTYTDGYLYASCIHAYTLYYHISRSMTCIYHY